MFGVEACALATSPVGQAKVFSKFYSLLASIVSTNYAFQIRQHGVVLRNAG